MCVKTIIHVIFFVTVGLKLCSLKSSPMTPFTLVESQALPRPSPHGYESNVVSQAATELLEPFSLHDGYSTTPVLPLSHFQFIPASQMRYSITLI